MLEIPFPNIDPVFLRIGPVQLRWYGLMYMLSFIAGYFLLRRLAKLKKLEMSADDLYDLLFFLILGVMVGGRVGSYEKVFAEAKQEALKDLEEKAKALGADAVVGIDLDYEILGADEKTMLHVSANGTAVKLG